MSRALHTAATGMHAQQLKIDVIANNLANVNTHGFKRVRAEFQDLLYQTLRIAGTRSSTETVTPTGLEVGLGARPAATVRNFETGDLQNTQNPMDIAIEGPGFFQVRTPGGEIALTRAGAFKVDERGELVTADGYPLDPPIVVPEDSSALTVGSDGLVTSHPADRSAPIEIGRIQLARVLNTGTLEGMGRNLYRVSGEQRFVQIGPPGQDGAGTLAQGFLEGSNVRVVEEMIAMIVGQRAYEANARVIQTADRMMEETNRLR